MSIGRFEQPAVLTDAAATVHPFPQRFFLILQFLQGHLQQRPDIVFDQFLYGLPDERPIGQLPVDRSRAAWRHIVADAAAVYTAMADVKAQSNYQRSKKIQNILDMQEIYQQILKDKECVTLKDLAVTGRDLMELGMEPGKELGDTLNELLEKVIDAPERNTKEYLCKYVRKKLKK